MNWSPVIRAAIASLKADMPAKIAVYNADPANQHDLTVIADEAFYFGGEEPKTLFPMVEVAIPGAQLTNFPQGQLHADMDDDFTVAVWLEGESGEISDLYERSLGYAEIVIDVLMKPGAFGEHLALERDRGVRARFPMIPQGEIDPDSRTFRRWRSLALLEFAVLDKAMRT